MTIKIYEDTTKHGDLYLTLQQDNGAFKDTIYINTIEDAENLKARLTNYIDELKEKGYE